MAELLHSCLNQTQHPPACILLQNQPTEARAAVTSPHSSTQLTCHPQQHPACILLPVGGQQPAKGGHKVHATSVRHLQQRQRTRIVRSYQTQRHASRQKFLHACRCAAPIYHAFTHAVLSLSLTLVLHVITRCPPRPARHLQPSHCFPPYQHLPSLQ